MYMCYILIMLIIAPSVQCVYIHTYSGSTKREKREKREKKVPKNLICTSHTRQIQSK